MESPNCSASTFALSFIGLSPRVIRWTSKQSMPEERKSWLAVSRRPASDDFGYYCGLGFRVWKLGFKPSRALGVRA